MKAILIILSVFFINNTLLAEEALQIQKFDLSQPGEQKLAYGSGLAFKKSNLYGAKYFYILASGSFKITDGKSPLAAQAVPHLALAKLKKKKFEIQARFPIVAADGQEFSIDPEGIALARDETIWLADEGGGRLLQLSADKGLVLQTLSIGKELPEILNQNQEGRGIEGVTITPNGKLYFIMQSPLNINAETAALATFVRLVEYDLAKQQSRMLAVPITQSLYASPSDIKFGDLQAIDNNRLLAIEQGKLKNGQAANKIVLLDITTASDLGNFKIDSREPEYQEDPLKVFADGKITAVKKSVLVDLREYNWPYKKAEGLTLVNASTIAIINDWGDDIAENQLWLIKLSEPLISWTAAEWFVFIIISLITLLAVVFIIKVIFSFKENGQAGTIG